MIVSPRGTTSGPSTVAAAIADNKAVLPFPRATDKAAVVTEGLNASLMNFFLPSERVEVLARKPTLRKT